jgi:predicted nucleic acid-binding protein
MSETFGDAFYFFALVNPRDVCHARAVDFAREFRGVVVTTRWVIAEVCDGLATATNRRLALALVRQVTTSNRFRLVHDSDRIFAQGFELFAKRDDKDWSLTDCISFAVMREGRLTDALTGDRHFEQAGFRALLT